MKQAAEQIAGQTDVNYFEYKRIKEFDGVGYFLENYVVEGGIVTKNVLQSNYIDVTEAQINLNGQFTVLAAASLRLSAKNSTYFLDFKDGDYTLGTSHPPGTAGTDYLQIATITTDSNGAVSTITDNAGDRGGFRLRPGYDFPEIAELQEEIGTVQGLKTVEVDPAFDNGVIINQAIQALTRGIVRIPKGKYNVTTRIDTKPDVQIIGDGYGVSILKYTGTDYCIRLGGGGTEVFVDFWFGLSIKDLEIEGTGSGAGGILVKGIARFAIENVYCHHFSNGYGIHFLDYAYIGKVESCNCTHNKYGIYASKTATDIAAQAFNAITICGQGEYQVNEYAIVIGDPAVTASSPILGMGSVITGITVEGNDKGGIWATSCIGLTITNVYFEHNDLTDANNGFDIKLGSELGNTDLPVNTVLENNLHLNDDFNIVLTRSYHTIIAKNLFQQGSVGIKMTNMSDVIDTQLDSNFFHVNVTVPVEGYVINWISPTLLNGWQNYGAPFGDCEYYKDGRGIVYLSGTIKSGVIGSPIFTLPYGYRPKYHVNLPTASLSEFGLINITNAGVVTATVGNNGWVSLDGISFISEELTNQ
jgi:hypothetical protein